MEWLYFTEGEATLHLGDEIVPIRAGQVAVIPPCEVHAVTVQEGVRSSHYVVGYDPELLQPMPNLALQLRYILPYSPACTAAQKIITIQDDDLPLIHTLITTVYKEYAGQPPGYELAVSAVIYQLVLWLVRNQSWLQLIAEGTNAVSRLGQLELALRYMDQHSHLKLTAEEMADKSGMSYSHFARTFKLMLRTSFTSYLIALRLRKAERMLLRPELTITHIALETGFNDTSYFIKLFKQHKGLTPQHYRSRMLGSQV